MRRIAYIRIPHFATAIERCRRSLAPDRPLILFEEDRKGRHRVYAYSDEASSEAAEARVKPNMRLRQAEALCPDAQVLPGDASKYAAVSEKWLERLSMITPDVEPDGLGTTYLDVNGLTRLYGEAQSICRRLGRETWEATRQWPAIGLANCKFVSRTTALRALPGHALIVPPGAERDFLSELPVNYLPVSAEMQRRLGLLGIHTLGQYAALHRNSVMNQFGREGVWAHRLARGHDDRKLVPRCAQAQEKAELAFDDPIENIATLEALAREIISVPLARLQSRSQVCQTIRMTLHFDDEDTSQRCLVLREPTAGSSRMEYLLSQLLRGFTYPCGVTGMAIALEDIRSESGHQLSLFANEQDQKDKLNHIIDQLSGKYTISRFYTARLVDDRAFLPERRFALQPFRSLS